MAGSHQADAAREAAAATSRQTEAIREATTRASNVAGSHQADAAREAAAAPPADPLDLPPGIKLIYDRLTSAPMDPELEQGRGKHNRQFMNRARGTIAADPEHPLRFLLDGRDEWLSREKYSGVPTVQAGHMISKHSQLPERLALEDSTFNQWSSNRGESQGAIFWKPAVDIGGVPVDRRTAMLWEAAGKLPVGTVGAAEAHEGWAPASGVAVNGAPPIEPPDELAPTTFTEHDPEEMVSDYGIRADVHEPASSDSPDACDSNVDRGDDW